ncbi:hypothetical protein [Schleiferilactobacillus shenzhenensis]|uniref:Uncharacterized protein n=1 Tax=Schleiferilactobacillus shenzhenensis LY-73 TaxID=1231336 RepID=U4TU02_9LACO|nr:hypothetical protein [Schleiferilactobacillus shenzhenensis]ERL64917.1 hypothetical protein L248_0521 [Schleiferilactobacillus shenzhenensis LY-73]
MMYAYLLGLMLAGVLIVNFQLSRENKRLKAMFHFDDKELIAEAKKLLPDNHPTAVVLALQEKFFPLGRDQAKNAVNEATKELNTAIDQGHTDSSAKPRG